MENLSEEPKYLQWLDMVKDGYDFWMKGFQESAELMDSFNYFEPKTVSDALPPGIPGSDIVKDGFDYLVDTSQRMTLFWDIIRKRGSIYLRYLQDGQPPVLTFDFEIVSSGKDLARPVNFDLVRIIPEKENPADPEKRPVIVIDPRAGHGPGIGGSKQESQVGMAAKDGHPVYFILFYPHPVPGQTLADVKNAEIGFIEEVTRIHDKSKKPSVIGNCQAGWSVALLSADKPGQTGPVVFNGSPLSYWSGVEGKDTMRYLGGIIGGIWLTSFLSDIGDGVFDGANLVMNFEMLNPANTFWTKQYNVYSRVDSEEDRYLSFERWWNGYCMMTSEEIHWIVDNLFIGNRLEQGFLELDQKAIDLKNLEDPIVVFASGGDNITPPGQALNWIIKVWDSVEELKKLQQTIVYILHKNIGHLGIFVSSKVATREHKEIIASFDAIEYLPPGLYELVIEESTDQISSGDFNVRFVERQFDDIEALEQGAADPVIDDQAFANVARLSEQGDELYKTWLRPLVKMGINHMTAKTLRRLHPLRIGRYAFSDINPFLFPVKALAPIVKKRRHTAKSDNLFSICEKHMSDTIHEFLDQYRAVRDDSYESMFKAIYNGSWMTSMFPDQMDDSLILRKDEAQKKRLAQLEARQKADLASMEEGGFAEGVIRMILAIIAADKSLDRKEFKIIQSLVREHEKFAHLEIADYKPIVRKQARILQLDEERAIKALAKMIPTEEERQEAVIIAQSVFAGSELSPETKVMIKKLIQLARINPPEKIVAEPKESKKSDVEA